MEYLGAKAMLILPLVVYVYLHARALVAWNSGWRLLAILLLVAQAFGAVFLLHFEPDYLARAIWLASWVGISVICLLWATQFLLNSAR